MPLGQHGLWPGNANRLDYLDVAMEEDEDGSEKGLLIEVRDKRVPRSRSEAG